jgi:hypothetical protein
MLLPLLDHFMLDVLLLVLLVPSLPSGRNLRRVRLRVGLVAVLVLAAMLALASVLSLCFALAFASNLGVVHLPLGAGW